MPSNGGKNRGAGAWGCMCPCERTSSLSVHQGTPHLCPCPCLVLPPILPGAELHVGYKKQAVLIWGWGLSL